MRERDALRTAIQAAVEGGKLLMRHWESDVRATPKESLRDVVTSIDRAAERVIIGHLRCAAPDWPIFAEESGRTGEDAEYGWVVDALDGTVNYVNRIPLFCVSIALFRGDEAVVGVVFNPMSNDLYYGCDADGAFKNQLRLRIDDRPFEECLFGAAFAGKSFEPERRADEFQLFQRVNDSCRGCLRTGSAAMNLAYLSEGRLGGCFGRANKLWDVGAGLLLARLAGAQVASRIVDRENSLVSYRATVDSAALRLAEHADAVLGLSPAS